MKVNIKKVAIWVGIGAVVAVSASAVVWNNSGFRAAERDVEAAYREVEALGIPLGADAFVASFTPKPEDNNAPGLLTAIDELQKFTGSLPPKDKAVLSKAGWVPDKQTALSEDLARVLLNCQPAMKKVRDNMKKSKFVPDSDWANPLAMPSLASSSLRAVSKMFFIEAKVEFERGNKEIAIERLKEIGKLSNFCSDSPMLIGALVQKAISDITAATTRDFIIADPKNAIKYRDALAETKDKPVGFILKAEVYSFAALCRNISAKEALGFITEEFDVEEETKERTTIKDGLPKDPQMRAYLAYSLNEWLPVLRQLNSDGTIKDVEAFEKALDKLILNLDKVTDPIAKLHKHFAQTTMSWYPIQRRSAATMAVADAFARVVEYHNQQGVYPTSLTEAGVTGVDPLSKDKKPLGYSVKNGEMRVWSVGYNRVDDGGLTPAEAFDLKPNSGNRRSPDQGDMTWVMPADRIAGKS